MFKYLSTPLVRTGWKNTIVNDADGVTLMVMPNGDTRHGTNALAAAQEATALFTAAPDMLEALEAQAEADRYSADLSALAADGTRLTTEHVEEAARRHKYARQLQLAAITKART